MSGNEKLERVLESFLSEDDSRVAALYRKLPRSEPDAKLDAAVLAMARRAVPTAAPAVRRSQNRWIPVFSAAAVIALAAGVSYRLGPQMWAERVDPARAPAASSADEVVGQHAAAPAAEMETRRLDAAAPASASAPAAPAGMVAVAPKPVPPQPEPQRERLAAKVSRALGPAAAADKKTENAIAPQAQAFPQQPAEYGNVQRNADAGAAVEATRAEPVPAAAFTVPESDLAKQAEPAPPPAARVYAPATVTAAPAPAPAPQAFGGAAHMQAPAAAQRDAAGVTPKEKSAQDANANLYPEHWLANIHKMLRDNRRDEARRSLAEFRKRYPDYHLPDDLRDLGK